MLNACVQGNLPSLTDPWTRGEVLGAYHPDLHDHWWLGLRSYGDGEVGVACSAE